MRIEISVMGFKIVAQMLSPYLLRLLNRLTQHLNALAIRGYRRINKP